MVSSTAVTPTFNRSRRFSLLLRRLPMGRFCRPSPETDYGKRVTPPPAVEREAADGREFQDISAEKQE
jgi:hypothetical protein